MQCTICSGLLQPILQWIQIYAFWSISVKIFDVQMRQFHNFFIFFRNVTVAVKKFHHNIKTGVDTLNSIMYIFVQSLQVVQNIDNHIEHWLNRSSTSVKVLSFVRAIGNYKCYHILLIFCYTFHQVVLQSINLTKVMRKHSK